MEQLFGAQIGAQIKQLFGARIRDPKGTAFRGPNRGPNRTSFRGPGLLWNFFSGAFWGPESGPESNNFSGPGALGCGCFSRDSLHATVSICTFVSTSRGPNPEPEWNSFSGPESNDFSGPGSWLLMFLQGLFGGHRFNLHICVHQPSFRGSNGVRLCDPNFWGPGLLAVARPLWQRRREVRRLELDKESSESPPPAQIFSMLAHKSLSMVERFNYRQVKL